MHGKKAKKTPLRIAIVGAGISGLATAFYLQRARPDWKLLIYDANHVPGGTMRTVECDGFRFEAGGNGFLTNKPDSMQLVRDASAEHLLLPSSDLARKRYIFTDRLHRLPETPPALPCAGLNLTRWESAMRPCPTSTSPWFSLPGPRA